MTLWLLLALSPLLADEGMWTLENFPADRVREAYGAEIDRVWLEKVRRATIRIEGGCTGSFVSPDGLVLTNHHCVLGCLSQISSAEHDAEAVGFLAASHGQEIRCEEEQISVLMEAEDITERISTATRGKDQRQANEARKRTLTRLEQACEEASAAGVRLSCESVSLYNGGQHFLYKYQRYEDVRLVFAPESSIAAFGGDPDNFNFPRYNLDMAFLRAYKNGQPARTPHYFRWRPEGAEAGEPVFISGHPGSTDRQLTVAELKWLREVTIPLWLMRYSELRGRLIQFGKSGEEPYRIVQEPLRRIENGLKIRRHWLWTLVDDELMQRKRQEEQKLRAAVALDPKMKSAYGSAWDEIEQALEAYRGFHDAYLFLEQEAAFEGTLFDYARTLVRAAAERRRPNQERLREFTESTLPQQRQRILARRPVYPELEELRLSFSLEKMREFLGPDSPYVKSVLGSESPDSLAHELVSGTELADPEIRRSYWQGGWETIRLSEDPLIRLALRIDDDSRALRKRYEDEVEAPQQAASAKIANARFAIEGTSQYPDATFTLRVTYGSVTGWREKGELVAPFTQTAGLFRRATGRDPFRLPPSWKNAEPRLKAETRFNFVANTDITGGNSGSPVIDRFGNLVGLAFDGNIHSIAGTYWFDASKNRTVAVHPAAMLEALDAVYGADRLVRELTATASAGSVSSVN